MKVQWIHKLICIYKIDLALKTNVKCHYTYILIWKVKWHIWINLLKLMCSILRYTEYINNTSIYMCGLRPYVCVSFSFYVLHWNTRVSLPGVKPCMILTVHFNFTESNISVWTIIIRIRRMSPVVVVDDISPVVRTGGVDRIRYRGSGVVVVPKTQHSVLLVCCVGDVGRES